MKAAGPYKSLVQGVSQQYAPDRRPGQHAEQVNMIPDPVQGLTRRHGSQLVAEATIASGAYNLAAMLADTATWRTFSYNNGGKDYTLLVRRAARPSGSDLPAMLAFNRTDSVWLAVQRPVTDAVLDQLYAGGASAVTAIGKYVFLAGNTITPAASTVDVWGSVANQAKAVLWVRGGAYSRTFKVTATKTDGSQVSFEYTTPKSSYPELLDTSKVPPYAPDPAGGTESATETLFLVAAGTLAQATLNWGDWNPTGLTVKDGGTTLTNVSPADPTTAAQYRWDAGSKVVKFHASLIGQLDISATYTKTKTIINPTYSAAVQKLTNDYNSAVTKWIGDAAEAIQPQAIAEQLRLAAVAAGLTTAVRQASAVIFDNVKALVAQDGGDGSLLRGVANEVTAAEEVSAVHAVGKVVKVRPKGSEDAFYLKATAKDPAITSGYTEVSWAEAAGTEYTITAALVMGTVSGGTMYLASSSALLAGILPGSHPAYVKSTVGDASTSPLPYFIGRKISYLGVFQDRLLIGSGGVVRASKIGDYLNFFRSSVLTAPANDALEMLSQGSEDDELRHSVLYDRDLVVFGVKRQYAISGRVALTPTSANMPVMSNHEGAGDVAPLAAGGLIFYTKQGERSFSAHQIQPGQVAESPESYSASTQLDTYLVGTAVEMAAMAKPTLLFARSATKRDSVYVFQYLDAQQGRQQDAWYRWDFASELGSVLGIQGTPAGLLVFSLREAHGSVWVVADLCPVTAGLSSRPYLDSQRPWATVNSGTGSVRPSTTGNWKAVFDFSTEYRLLGANLADAAALQTTYPAATGMQVGVLQQAYFVPTNPVVLDNSGKAITTGRLTVTKLLVTMSKSSGFSAEVTGRQITEVQTDAATSIVTSILDSLVPTSDDVDFNGYVFGDPNAKVGRVPVTDSLRSVPIGKESREYDLVLRARTWMPFTVTAIDWVGQFFNRARRV